jgi:hypothetical protein
MTGSAYKPSGAAPASAAAIAPAAASDAGQAQRAASFGPHLNLLCRNVS